MRKITRRELLRMSAAGAVAYALGGVLAACKGQTTSESTSAPPESTGTPAATAAPTAAATPTADATATAEATPGPTGKNGETDLVVVRNGEPEPLVRTAVEALGGMGKFVPKGASVVVKPNICVSYRTPEFAATTNPVVVATLVKMALEAGAKTVKVLDYPFGGLPEDAYAMSGVGDAVKAAGGDTVVVSDQGFVETQIPEGKSMTKTDVFRDVLDADVLINVPIAKHHYVTDLSLGMKNLMGVVYNRDAMHMDIHQCIVDLNTLIRPALTVVDCTRILTDNGPQGGDLADVKQLDTIIASADVVAADSYAATLFDKQPRDIGYIRLAADSGLGECDLSAMNIKELTA
jgi:uncharacterized protein (DUF362 family)